MPANQISKGTITAGKVVTKALVVDGVDIGATTTVLSITTGNVSIDPPSILTGATATVSVTIAGVSANDIVTLEPPATLEAGLVPVAVRAKSGGADLDILNSTAGTIDGASRSWKYKVIDGG
jgi:hypothetical protein